MRYAARADENQTEIVKMIRSFGATVQHLHMVGQGCPDLLVGFRGHNFLFECKDGSKPPSQRRLTDQQQAWHGKWNGNVVVIKSPDDVVRFFDRVRPGERLFPC